MSDTTKVSLTFEAISQRLKQFQLPQVDAVVGIATGGTVPAMLVAHQLGCAYFSMRVSYRAPDNTPQYSAPQLISVDASIPENAVVLLVDDVSVSGQTLAAARAALSVASVYTLVLKGQGADFVAFPEVASCVLWPWKPPHAA